MTSILLLIVRIAGWIIAGLGTLSLVGLAIAEEFFPGGIRALFRMMEREVDDELKRLTQEMKDARRRARWRKGRGE